jgi:hypothetical protein
MDCRWAGFKTPEIIINGANHNQLMVDPDALATKDTLVEVPDNERICFLQTGIVGRGIKVY